MSGSVGKVDRQPRFEAVLVLSFGGPEGMDDVLPFLENVLRGTRVPKERMLEVAEHYREFGGVSPINAQNRALISALERKLAEQGPMLPVYWGNRNWHPMLADTLRTMKKDGVSAALAFVTSAYGSYSGCRQYLEDIERARREVGSGAPRIDKLRNYFNHPGFIEANAEGVREALKRIEPARRQEALLLFTAHSIPVSMASTCAYEVQLREVCRLVSEAVGHARWDLVFQSRSGPPDQLWLEPDVCDSLEETAESGVDQVVISPIGFISDHLEVLYDLDTEARKVGERLGLNLVRAATAGTHPAFIGMIRELVLERVEGRTLRRTLGRLEPNPDVCPPDCCRYTPSRPGG